MCKARIEKAEGCNHMTCYYCEFQFCWLCGGTYTSDHFVLLNPLGCGGLQFGNFIGNSRTTHMILVQFKRLLSLILLILAAPFILVFGPPFALCAMVYQCCSRSYNRGGALKTIGIFLLMIVIFAIGLCLDVIVVPLAIVIGIPVLIGWQIYERWDKWRRAKERLQQRMQEAMQI